MRLVSKAAIMFRDSWAGLISATWERIAKRAQEDFDLDYIAPPDDIYPSYESPPQDFGGWIEGSTLILSSECLRGKIPHIAILARGYLRKALKRERFENYAIEDFANAFGALWLSSRDLDYWYNRWADTTGSMGDENTGVYSPAAAFHLFQSFSGTEYFDKLLNEYILMKRGGLKLDKADYILHMLERVRRFSVHLTQTDFSLIRRLLLAPNTPRADLAAETKKTPSWVSRRLVTLQEHGVLKRNVEIFYPGMGMREFILLLDSLDESTVAEYVMNHPFLYSANHIIAGEFDIIAHLYVPQNTRNLYLLDLYLRILRDNDIETRLFEIQRINGNRCFDHYNPRTNLWELPWELFGPHLRRIHTEGLSSVMLPQLVECKPLPLSLNKKDFQLISEYKSGIPLREIRAHLGMKYRRLANRLSELKEKGLVRDSYDLYHCGLNELLFVHIPDPSYWDSIVSWAQRLPYTQSFYDGKDNGLLLLRLPDGGLQGMALVLQSLSSTLKPMLLDQREIVGPWYVSQSTWAEKVTQLWDEEGQVWRNSEEEMTEWISSLP